MSRQIKLDSYFKSKVSKTLKFEKDNDNYQFLVNVKQEMDITPQKRSNLSLMKSSPSKTPKINGSINLLSDDEDTPLDVKSDQIADSSDSTVIYTPTTPKKSPNTSSQSSSSGRQYYSPNKKRNITRKSPKKVQKNLNKIYHKNNESFALIEHCKGLDDKTVFLLKLIHQYLNEQPLKQLLDECSQSLLEKSMSLVKPGLLIVCRLYWRKEGWYREEMLKKIVDKNKSHLESLQFQLMLDSLLQNGFLSKSINLGENISLNIDDYYNMLKANEVKQICKEFKLKFTSKEAARKDLLNFANKRSISNYFGGTSTNNYNRVLNLMRAKCGESYILTEVTRRTLNELYVLMYLGMNRSILTDKKLELTLINEKANIETYPVDENMPIDNASVVFKNRYEYYSYYEASTIYEEFINSSDDMRKREIVENVYKLYQNISSSDMTSYKSLPVWLRKFTSAYLYVKILEGGVPSLKKSPEKEKYCQLAVEILTTLISQDAFRQHKKMEWFAEKSLIYENHMNDPDKAAEVLLEGLRLDILESKKDCLRVRGRKLAKRVTNKPADKLTFLLEVYDLHSSLEKDITPKHIYKQPMETFSRGKKKFQLRLEDSTMVLDVEEFCKWHYINQGNLYTHGEHWEGSIITTLFTLLFWDIIYTELRGVRGLYLTRYQRYPLDMYTECFYTNRRCLIDDRLADIERKSIDDHIRMMKDVWDSRPECEISGINRKIGWEKIDAVARCLGGRSLATICRRLALDYGYCHSGFPDLTMWNPHTKQIVFVEVKTDTDKLSIKQLQWLHYLQDNDINVEICYVGTNTTRCKARSTLNSDI